jgi:FixJ family two-component response regulator
MTHTSQMISIVDDDLSVRRALRRVVRLAGYTAEAFASAREFLASAPGGRIACLVLDIHLDSDRTGGFDLQEQLVADGVAIPTIFITAHDDARTRERVQQSGVAGYLPKPFRDGALLDMIRTVAGPV